MKIKIFALTHKKFEVPQDKMYQPLQVGREEKEGALTVSKSPKALRPKGNCGKINNKSPAAMAAHLLLQTRDDTLSQGHQIAEDRV